MQEPTRVRRWWNGQWPWQRALTWQMLIGLVGVLVAGILMALLWRPGWPLWLGIGVALVVGGMADGAATMGGIVLSHHIEDRHQRKHGARSQSAR